MSGEGSNLSRQYVKLCELEDFDDPGLRAMLRDVVPGREPREELHRKYWEYAMLGCYLQDVGALREDVQVLAVAAGHEAMVYWLTPHVGKVVATDIYGEGSFSAGEADATMLTDPAAFSPYAYREDRLEVHSMNARSRRGSPMTASTSSSRSPRSSTSAAPPRPPARPGRWPGC